MSVLENFKNTPRSPYGGATGPPAAPVGWAQRSPEGGATGPPCRPLGGRQAPLFFQRPRCKFEEKKHLGPVALWGATGEYF